VVSILSALQPEFCRLTPSLISSIRATFTTHFIPSELIIIIIFVEEYMLGLENMHITALLGSGYVFCVCLFMNGKYNNFPSSKIEI
jgi:uncharacterized membrane protein